MSTLPKELIDLKRFHGHLGPYAVIGYRMGVIARARFPERIYALLHSGTRRPLSCMADGVQMSSCCTLGKGNITLRDDGEASAEFSDGFEHLRIDLLPEIRARIDTETTHATEEKISQELYEMPDASIFKITEGGSPPSAGDGDR
ncbi:MAG TPA: formylmethanofuran dehydrogenase subunit E family protein [Methanomassiliicoccaceae archaeon]|nr:formylmethanofuran dehydrogenase subunit E family protein [Methanomassiliicoccaceae archaeon]